MSETETELQSTIRRIAIFGASNVTLGLPTIVHHVRAGFEGPMQIDIADGHGRSYGDWTSVCFRQLPGHCEGVVAGLQSHHNKHAVLTDIGNDLVLGVQVPQIAAWVSEVAGRLADAGAEITMTRLPLASVRSLSKFRFGFFRRLFFPTSPLPDEGLVAKVQELDEQVLSIATQVGAQVVEPRKEWYGLDPIHIRRTARSMAWTEVFGAWSDWQLRSTVNFSALRKLSLWRSTPQTRRVFGRLRCHQRLVNLDDETQIRFF